MTLKTLKKGDLVGIIATSSPVEPKRFESGVKYLQSLGFRTEIALDPTAEYASKRYLFSSAPANERAAALGKLFENSEVKAVIAARGAYGAMEVLPLLNLKLLAKNPKPFIGFSDATALLVALEQIGCPVIHGQNVESLWNAAEETAVAEGAQALSAWLTSHKNPFEGFKAEYLSSKKNEISGSVVGGNLSILAALCGTPWQLKADGKILFFEDVGEKPYRLHRMLLQLVQSDSLRGVRGVLVGNLKNCDSEQGATQKEALIDVLSPLNVPVIMGLPCGHDKKNLPLPFGVPITVKDGEIKIS